MPSSLFSPSCLFARKSSILLLLSLFCCFLFLCACSNGHESPLYVEPAGSKKAEVQETVQPYGQTWSLQPGLLRGQLEGWARAADYQLVWKVSRDYYLQSSVLYTSSFQEALTRLLNGMQQRGNALRATLFEGNRVVLISDE